jgi:chromosome segregation ATPase
MGGSIMSIKAKLHDALLILDRQHKDLESNIQLDHTDATDSQESFDRRYSHLADSLTETLEAIAKLQKTQAVLEREMNRMRTARDIGPGVVAERKRQLADLDQKRQRVRLALVKLELEELSSQ